MSGRGWWRRNGAWLAALPVLVAGTVAANGERLVSYWWPDAPRQEIARAAPGEWVDVTQEFSDVHGPTSRSFRVRLRSLDPTDEVVTSTGTEPLEMPEGVTALAVRLDFAADPDQQISSCRLEVLGADGSRYVAEANTPSQDSSYCVPQEQQGPKYPLFESDERGAEPDGSRPAEWSVSPVVLVPTDAEPVAVRIYYDLPEFVRLDAPS